MAVLRRWILAAAIVFAAAPLQAQAPADSSQFELGRRYTQWLYQGQADSLWGKFSPEMRQAIPSAQAMTELRGQLQAQVGTETEVVSEHIMDPSPQPGLTVYVRTARFSTAPMLIEVMVATDAEGIIQGFTVRPQAPPNPTD
ncbi:MAG TPA: hypothetical protein VFY65_05480 [Longimicrobium sp.]|nr:hypothetical protein [Longimicrobium sp.]